MSLFATPAQRIRITRITMGLLALAYLGTALIFTFWNEPFFSIVLDLGRWLGAGPEPTPVSSFYRSLALGNMYMLVFMSFMTWRDPVGYYTYFLVVLVSKASSSGMGVLFYLLGNGYFSNLVIPISALSQVFLGWIFYRWMKQISLERASGPTAS